MDAGIFTINTSDFYVKELIDEVFDIYYQQWGLKNIDLLVNFDESLNEYMIKSDKSRLKQILMNLLSNSYKFTFSGSISISVQPDLVENEEVIKFWVTDTGIGIKEENQPKLFKLFGMVKNNNQKDINPNGWGIGLTVSK